MVALLVLWEFRCWRVTQCIMLPLYITSAFPRSRAGADRRDAAIVMIPALTALLVPQKGNNN
jgi:hypothetical protein